MLGIYLFYDSLKVLVFISIEIASFHFCFMENTVLMKSCIVLYKF